MSQQKIKSLQDICNLREALCKEHSRFKQRILVCMTGCRALGSADVAARFELTLKAMSLDDEVEVVRTGCIGICAKAPVVLIEPRQVLYGGVTDEDVDEIVRSTVVGGQLSPTIASKDGRYAAKVEDIPFYTGQKRIVLGNCGRIDPTRIEDAVERGCYVTAVRTISRIAPDDVIKTVTDSGLRGRGGAGFLTGVKWGFARRADGTEKYLICNADEGDPGAFMDRALLEGDPHRVIEGMIIAAYAIGANKGFVYVRAEYPIAVEHVTLAIDQARRLGLLGAGIAGTNFNFDIEVRMGAGAFVCGEETALIASIEGKRGMPRPRPPFPAQSGYLGKPTNINNVETFANVPIILDKGADWYSAIGTEKSKGTKIFALAGRVNNTGLVEVPMGTTLRRIIYDIGGGIGKGRKFKAAQLGGPSGGCIPAGYLDTEIDYDSVQQAGAIMGSGGMIVMDDNTCMVDIARYFLEFVQSESCGKCTACRVGTRKMLEILKDISSGNARIEVLDELERLAVHVKKASLCGLGQTASNPVLSTLRHFRDEYEEHIVLKTCRAAACAGLVRVPCQHACPAGVNVPEYVALAGEGRLKEAASIIRRRNPFVSVCGRVCDHPCERRCRRSELDHPVAIRALKRYIADNMDDYDAPSAPPAKGDAEVAIIGSGPAGLSCAYFLALLGRRSVIFEAQPIPGGMLALGIPEYRLPKETLSREIDFILSHGVELRTNAPVKSAASLLKDGFKTVFVATGAQKGRPIEIEGSDHPMVIDALEFLRKRALGQQLPCDGKRIVVLGGGNSAVDAARSAVRLGAKKLTVLYRRTREEMPAYQEEIDAAIQEGVELIALAIPHRVLTDGDTLTGIEYVLAALGTAGDDGRRRPVPIDGSNTVIDCDIVIPAIGQIPSGETLADSGGQPLTEWGAVAVDPLTGKSKIEGIFAGGDCATGAASVIEAIAGGQKAAVHIDRYLGGAGRLPLDVGFSFAGGTDESGATERPAEPELPLSQRKRGFAEVVLGLDRRTIAAEAGRCLRCDLERA
jgi:NADH-quinone oxidoreductase subunit F